MHHQVDWLRPTDRSIVREIHGMNGAWVKPATLALNVDLSRSHVARRCKVLADHDLLERFDEDTPAYRVSEFGERFLRDELDTEDLLD